MMGKPILRRPLEVALLNLNGAGLGFLYAGRWIRFILYLLLGGVILTTAFFTKAHRLPWFWAIVFLFWPLWQAFDGWLAAIWRNRRYPGAVIPWRWPALVVGVLTLGATLMLAVGCGLLGQWEYRKGMAAFARADFAAAGNHFENFTTYYTLTLNPNLRKAEEKINECTRLQQAARLSKHGNYSAAIASYREYRERYGATEADSYVREQIAENYRLWALELLTAGDYEQSIEKYLLIQQEYADTESGRQVEQNLAEAYERWGQSLLEQEAYEDAIDKYRHLAAHYPATEQATRAPVSIARVYIAWGRALDSDGDFLGALAKLQQAQIGVDDARVLEEAKRQYESVLYHLSRDPGTQGWSVMHSTLSLVCKGEPAASPAIGYQVNESPRTRLCRTEDTPAYALPFDLQAEYPAHFLYAIRISEGSSRGRDCGWYINRFTGARVRLYLNRPWWKVEIISTLTGVTLTSKRFDGKTSYSYCPSTYSYSSGQLSGNEVHDEGIPPEEDSVSRWLRQVIEKR